MFQFFTFESTPFKFLKHGVVVSPFKLSFNPLRLKELASCSLPCAASSPPVDSLGCNTCHKIKFDQISGARGVAQSHNFQEKECSHLVLLQPLHLARWPPVAKQREHLASFSLPLAFLLFPTFCHLLLLVVILGISAIWPDVRLLLPPCNLGPPYILGSAVLELDVFLGPIRGPTSKV